MDILNNGIEAPAQVSLGKTILKEMRPHYRLHASPDTLKGWRVIFMEKNRENYPKSVPLIEQGEYVNCLYYIVSGLVECTHIDEDGIETLLEVQGPGIIMGLQPFFQKAPSMATFSALTDVVAATLSEDEVYAHIGRDNSLATELTIELCNIVDGLVRRIFSNTEHAHDRIIEFLCELCEIDVSEKMDNGHFYIGLTQSEFARVARTTRVTAAKVFGELKKMDYLDTVYSGIIVKDYHSLKRIATEKEA